MQKNLNLFAKSGEISQNLVTLESINIFNKSIEHWH